jgi:hypothetical protein
MPIVNLIVLKKYNDPKDKQNYEIGKVYKKKLATNIFKIFFYLFMTTLGFYLLSQLEYFPTSLGGEGALHKMFEKGFPDCMFHWKPENFEIYYMTGLGFCLTDLIWLLFIYELQTDFKMMLLHHLCTISLITFSYLTNYTNVGSIILFLHDIGDIFVYFARIIINIEVKSAFKSSSGILLVIIFIYTRIYVFGHVLYTIYTTITWKWESEMYCLYVFLCFLYMMHINWVYLILKKIYTGLFENKFEDTGKFKKVEHSS